MSISVNGTPVSQDNPLPVTGSGVASGATDSGNPVKVGGVYNSTQPTLTTGQRGDLQLDSRANARVVIMNVDGVSGAAVTGAASDALASQSGVWVNTQPRSFNGSTWDRTRKPVSTSRIVSAAASTNATSAKASAGDLTGVLGYNAAAAVRYVKFYNKASAPTVGTDTPVLTIAIPATTAFDIQIPNGGFYFSTGIAYALTTGAADNDTGALTAADILGLNVIYA